MSSRSPGLQEGVPLTQRPIELALIVMSGGPELHGDGVEEVPAVGGPPLHQVQVIGEKGDHTKHTEQIGGLPETALVQLGTAGAGPGQLDLDESFPRPAGDPGPDYRGGLTVGNQRRVGDRSE